MKPQGVLAEVLSDFLGYRIAAARRWTPLSCNHRHKEMSSLLIQTAIRFMKMFLTEKGTTSAANTTRMDIQY